MKSNKKLLPTAYRLLPTIFFLLLTVYCLLPTAVWAAISTVDSQGGAYSSIKLQNTTTPDPNDDYPAIAYFDHKTGELRYSYWITNGTTVNQWIRGVVEEKGVTGYVSLWLDNSNKPYISYYHNISKNNSTGTEISGKYGNQMIGALKYAYCSAVPCLTPESWTKVTVTQIAQSSNGHTGGFTSLAFDSSGNPRIAYYDFAHKDNPSNPDEKKGALKLAYCNSNCGVDGSWNNGNWINSNWSISKVDSEGGRSASMVIYNDKVMISYDADEVQKVKYAESLDLSTWTRVDIGTVVNNGNLFRDTAIAINSSGKPRIVYQSQDQTYYSGAVSYPRNSNCCYPWNQNILKRDAFYAYCDADCTNDSGWSTPNGSKAVNLAGGNTYLRGYTPSIKVGSNGIPKIAYHYWGHRANTAYTIGLSQDLHVVTCGNAGCSAGNSIDTTTHTTNNTGLYSSMILDSSDKTFISYYNSDANQLMLYHPTNSYTDSGITANARASDNQATVQSGLQSGDKFTILFSGATNGSACVIDKNNIDSLLKLSNGHSWVKCSGSTVKNDVGISWSTTYNTNDTLTITVYSGTGGCMPTVEVGDRVSLDGTCILDSNGNPIILQTEVKGNTGVKTPPAGAVAYYKMDEGSKMTAYDSVGTHNASLNNGVTWTSGFSGYGLSFDGSNDYLSVPISPGELDNAPKITIEAWLKPDNLGTGYTVLSKEGSYIMGSNGQCNITTTGTAGSWFGGTGVNYIRQQQGLWRQVVCTSDGTTQKVYIDGILDGQIAATGNVKPSRYPFVMGRRELSTGLYRYIGNEGCGYSYSGHSSGCSGNNYWGTSYYKGKMDEVVLYNTVLSPDEINSRFKGMPGQLERADANDSSGNGYGIQAGDTVKIKFTNETNAPTITKDNIDSVLQLAAISTIDDFSTDTSASWTSNQLTDSVSGGVYNAALTSVTDPFFYKTTSFSGVYNVLEFIYKGYGSTGPSSLTVYYTDGVSCTVFGAACSQTFTLIKDSNWHTLAVTVSDAEWNSTDTIGNLRFDFDGATGTGTMQVESIKFKNTAKTWLDGSGNIGSATWNSPTNDTLTVTLGSGATFAIGDTIIPNGTIKDKFNNSITNTIFVKGSFDYKDMVALWSFDSNVNDSIGQYNNGTISYVTTAPTYTAGKFGNTISLASANSQYVYVLNSPDINPSTISVEAWAKSSASTWNANGALVSKRPAYILYPVSGTKNMQFWVYAGGAWQTVTFDGDSDSSFDITQWHHYVGTYDGNQIKIYVDGKLKGTPTDYVGTINTADLGVLTIGRDDGQAAYLNGFIDEVAIYNRAILDSEVSSRYGATFKSAVAKAVVSTPGIQAGDKVVIIFDASTGATPITSTNIDTALALSSSHSWKSGSGAIGSAVWSQTTYPNDTLTITLSTTTSAPTVAVGDTITLGGTIKDTLNRTLTGTIVIGGSFGNNLPSGAVAYYNFDEQGGTNAFDSIGNNHGTMTTSFWKTERIFKGLYFDGSRYVQVPDHSDFDLSSYTLDAWVRVPNGLTTGVRRIISQDDGTNYWKLQLNNNILELCDSRFTTPASKCISSATAINDGEWHHVAAVRDGTANEVILYTDGVPDAPVSTVGGGTAHGINSTIQIGRKYNATEYFYGFIDEIAVYNNTALSPAQIQTRYRAPVKAAFTSDPTFLGSGKQTGDKVIIRFHGKTNAFAIDGSNIATNLTLSSSHNWGSLATAEWSTYRWTNDTLTITLGTGAATVAKGDTITINGANIKDIYGNAISDSITLDGDFYLNLPDGAVSYWRLDSSNSDSFGTNNIVTNTGAWLTAGCMFGNCLNFSAVNNSASINNARSLNPERITVEAWVYGGATWSGNSYFFNSGSTAQFYGTTAATTVNFRVYVDGAWRAVSYTPSSITGWHHYAGTYDGTNLKLYMDGVLVGTPVAYTGVIYQFDTGAFYLGAATNGSAYYMDDVVVYNRALTSDDIMGRYAQYSVITAIARDTSGGGVGIQAGDTVTIKFPGPTNGAVINASNIDTALALSSSHSWKSGSGAIGSAVWSQTTYSNDTLTITLSTTTSAPSVAPQDTITISSPIEAKFRETTMSSKISGLFGDSLPAGKISYWNFNEQSGTTAFDSIGNNHGTMTTSFWKTERIFKGLYFDGSRYVQVPDHSDFDLSSYTLDAWVRVPNGLTTGVRRIISQDDGTNYWKLQLNNNILELCDSRFTTPASKCISSATAINDGEWHHVAAVRDGSANEVILYTDGVPDAPVSTVGGGTAHGINSTIQIGRKYNATEYFYGFIDEIAVYNNTALSPAQIQTRYRAPVKAAFTSDPTFLGSGKQTGDKVIIRFHGKTNAFAITSGNIAATLALSSSHTWGTFGTAEWSTYKWTNDTLTITLGSGTGTIAKGDTITINGANIKDIYGNAISDSITLDGDFYLNLPDGAVSYWRLDSSNIDSFGTNNIVTNTGAWLTAGCMFGNCLNFSAVNQNGQINNSISLNPERITIEGWMYGGATWSGDSYLFNSGSTAQFYGTTAATTVNFRVYVDGAWRAVSYTPSSITGWHHYAGTYDGTNLKLYMDGVLVGTPVAYTGVIYQFDTGAFYLGAATNGSAYYADDAAVYNRALTLEEILGRYGQYSPITAFAKDSSGGGVGIQANDTVKIKFSGPTNGAVINAGNIDAVLTPGLHSWLDGSGSIGSAVWSQTTYPNDTLTITLSATTSAPTVAPQDTISLGGAGEINAKYRAMTWNTKISGTFGDIYPQTPVAHWKLDENTGTIAFDSVGTNDGTLTNSPAWTNPALFNSGLNFNTSSAYLNVGSITLSNDWAVEAWFSYPLPSTATYNTLFGSAADRRITVRRTDLHLGTTNGSTFVDSGYVMSTLSPGWHHIVAVGYGISTIFYIDSVEVGLAPFKSAAALTAVGNMSGGSEQFGTIDEAVVYPVFLIADEVKSRYLVFLKEVYAKDTTRGGSGIQAGDQIIVKFDGATNGPSITNANINTALVLSSSHSWLDGSGNIGSAVWSQSTGGYPNDTLTITLSTTTSAPTVAMRDTVTLGGSIITDAYSKVITGTVQIGGDFGTTLPDGAVAYWKLDEGINTIAYDSFNDNNGTLTNTPSWITGKISYGLNFTGGTGADADYVAVNNSADLNQPKITVEAWAKSGASAWNSSGTILSKTNAYILYPVSGTKNMQFHIYAGGAWRTVTFTADANFDITQWHHYAGTYDRTNIKIYVDGELKGTTAYTLSINTLDTGALTIGRDYGATVYLNGDIDEVVLYNRALTQTELRGRYSTWFMNANAYGAAGLGEGVQGGTIPDTDKVVIQFTGETNAPAINAANIDTALPLSKRTNLIAYWTFDAGSGTSAADSGSYGNTGTICSNAACTTYSSASWSPGDAKYGNALSFNGTSTYVQVANSASLSGLTSQVTVSAWAKSGAAAWNSNGSLVSKRNAYILYPVIGSKDVVFYVYGADAAWHFAQFTADGAFDITQWHQYVGTYDGKFIKLYVDGVEKAVAGYYGSIGSDTGVIQIGRDDGQASYLNGKMDNVLIFNYALSPEDVQSQYNTPEPSTLTWKDGSGNLNGNAVWSQTGLYQNDTLTINLSSATSSPNISAPNTRVGFGNTVKDILGRPLTGTVALSGTFGNNVLLSSAAASDASSGGKGVQTNDRVVITFNGTTNGAVINAGNINAVLQLNDGHTWLDGAGNIVSALWNANKDILTITLSAATLPAPTVNKADTITINDGTIKDVYGNTVKSSINITGSFGYTLPSGAVAYYDFDDRGAMLYDNTSNNNNGYLNRNSPITWTTDARAGKALNFNGTTEYIYVPDSSSLRPANITVEAWVKSDTATWSNINSFVSKSNNYKLGPATAATKNVTFQIYGGGAWRSVTFTPPDANGFDITTWHHYAGTYDGSNVRLYVDGVEKGTPAAYIGSIDTTGTNPLGIGRDYGSAFYLDGNLDEIVIYNRALSSTEILGRSGRLLISAAADDNSAKGPNIQSGDRVVIKFNGSTNAPLINAGNINAVLALSSGHSWLDENGALGGTGAGVWTTTTSTNDTLTITLSGPATFWDTAPVPPTVAIYDKITLDGTTITDTSNPINHSVIVSGGFGSVSTTVMNSGTADDNSGKGPNIQSGDRIVIRFNGQVNGTIDANNIDTVLALSNGHTWKDGNGAIGNIAWSTTTFTNDTLTITLSGPATYVATTPVRPTVVVGDTITINATSVAIANAITDSTNKPISCNIAVTGGFGTASTLSLVSSIAYDTSNWGPNIQSGDSVVIKFSGSTSAPLINADNIDTLLPLDNGHSWLDGSATPAIVSAVWSQTTNANDTLTITLSGPATQQGTTPTAPTVAAGDKITMNGGITDAAGKPIITSSPASQYSYDFTGTTITGLTYGGTTAGWISQSNILYIRNNANAWDTYVFTNATFTRAPGMTFQASFNVVSLAQAMIGWHDNGTGASYTDLIYAIYFDNGTLRIYEDGALKASPTTYTAATWYDVKIELKGTGAKYYYKLTSSPTWILLYDSNYSPVDGSDAALRPGIAHYTNNKYSYTDNWSVGNGSITGGFGSPTGNLISSAVASGDDGKYSSLSKAVIKFSGETNGPAITAANIDAVLQLNNGHSWKDGNGAIGSAVWTTTTYTNDTLTITLSLNGGTPSVNGGDTITLDNATIKDKYLIPINSSKIIGGDFGMPSSVKALWSLNATSGTVVSDSIGTYSGTLTNSGGSATTWTSGRFNNGLYLDGTTAAGDYVTLTNQYNLTASWTIEAWFKWPISQVITNQQKHVIISSNSTSNENQITVDYQTKQITSCNGGTCNYVPNYDLKNLSTGWHHIAAVGTGGSGAAGTTQFYIDGNYVGTSPYKSASHIKYIGNSHDVSRPWSNTIDNIIVYDTALSAATIKNRYGAWPRSAFAYGTAGDYAGVTSGDQVVIKFDQATEGNTINASNIDTALQLSGSHTWKDVSGAIGSAVWTTTTNTNDTLTITLSTTGGVPTVAVGDTITLSSIIKDHTYRSISDTVTLQGSFDFKLPLGAIAYWRFNEGSGVTVNDSFGSNHANLPATVVDTFDTTESWTENNGTSSVVSGWYNFAITNTADPFFSKNITDFEESYDYLEFTYQGYGGSGPSTLRLYYTDGVDCASISETCAQSFTLTRDSSQHTIYVKITDAEWVDNDGIIGNLRFDLDGATATGTFNVDSIKFGTVMGANWDNGMYGTKGVTIDAATEAVDLNSDLSMPTEWTIIGWIKTPLASGVDNALIHGTVHEHAININTQGADHNLGNLSPVESGSSLFRGTGYYVNKQLKNGWHQIAAVGTGGNGTAGTTKYYIDGQPVSGSGITNPVGYKAYFPIASIGNNTGAGLHAIGTTIDEILIYDRPLSAAEIRQYYGAMLKYARAKDASGLKFGIDVGDQIVLKFDGETNAPTIDASNIDTVLKLSNGHTWLDGNGAIGSAVWSTSTYTNDTLTITLSTGLLPPTLTTRDTITLSEVEPNVIKDLNRVIRGSIDISGDFDGAIAYYDLDESSAVTATDTINDNNGTLGGQSSTLPAWVSGYSGSALDFNDTNSQYVTIPDNDSFNMGSYTIEGWIKLPVTIPSGNYMRIVSQESNTNPTNYWSLAINSSGQLVHCDSLSSLPDLTGYDMGGKPSGQPLYCETVTTKTLNDDKWHFVAVVRNTSANNFKFFIDSTLEKTVASSAGTDTHNIAGTVEIGRKSGFTGNPTSSEYFRGIIDNVAIYNYALTDTEVFGHHYLYPSEAHASNTSGLGAGIQAGDTVTLLFNGETGATSVNSGNIAAVLKLPSGKSWGTFGSAVWSTTYYTNDTLKITLSADAVISVGDTITLGSDTINVINDTHSNLITGSVAITGSFEINSLLGTVAYWRFDEGIDPATISDTVGIYNGTINNPIGDTDHIWVTPAKFLYGLDFPSGNKGYVNLPTNVPLSSNEWTIEAWVYAPLATNGTNTNVLINGSGAGTEQIVVATVSGTRYLGTYATGGVGFVSSGYCVSETPLACNNNVGLTTGWHHLVAVGKAGATKFYIDGSLKGTANHQSNVSIARIGNGRYVSPEFQNPWGKVDDVVIYSRALSTTEISDRAAR